MICLGTDIQTGKRIFKTITGKTQAEVKKKVMASQAEYDGHTVNSDSFYVTAQKFIDNLQVFSLLANVADVKSLAIHPASTTHSQLNAEELEEQGIRPNTIRLSIGTEHIDDILYDLQEAFENV